MKNEAKWHIQSLQVLFEDRVQLMKEQSVGIDDSVIKAQRQMSSEVCGLKILYHQILFLILVSHIVHSILFLRFIYRLITSTHSLYMQLKKSFSDQRKSALSDQKNLIMQKRQYQLVRRREAQKDLLALLSVEKWDDSLRSYAASREKIFPSVNTSLSMSGHGRGFPISMNKRTRRPRSAPPVMRRSSISGTSNIIN